MAAGFFIRTLFKNKSARIMLFAYEADLRAGAQITYQTCFVKNAYH